MNGYGPLRVVLVSFWLLDDVEDVLPRLPHYRRGIICDDFGL